MARFTNIHECIRNVSSKQNIMNIVQPIEDTNYSSIIVLHSKIDNETKDVFLCIIDEAYDALIQHKQYGHMYFSGGERS